MMRSSPEGFKTTPPHIRVKDSNPYKWAEDRDLSSNVCNKSLPKPYSGCGFAGQFGTFMTLLDMRDNA